MLISSGERDTIRDAEGSDVGRAMARLDRDIGRSPATDEEIYAYLGQVASDRVTGWAEDAAVRAYRAEWLALSDG